ncbi:hypothetical protein [Tenacibaculum retecalamus]|uniref:hypothetical protein n=1 Tax=Tenacibaculum retecalamus TaxID=3018315 RepID=UPI0023D8FBE1|nr:hypothetical protein [Tenacibaculum retecalamus]WBX70565.1 hypothetical protein PG912_09870 [Tenacibaculum retecalamus]
MFIKLTGAKKDCIKGGNPCEDIAPPKWIALGLKLMFVAASSGFSIALKCVLSGMDA